MTAQIPSPGQLPGVEPLHESGQDVTPAFEGWFKNPDGSFELLFGYNNRNLKQELDIPIGPNNKVEPAVPMPGQPTHFMPRRGWGVFTVKVPKDFGTKKVTWTLSISRPHQRDSGEPRFALGDRRAERSDVRQHAAGASSSDRRARAIRVRARSTGPRLTATVGKPLTLDCLRDRRRQEPEPQLSRPGRHGHLDQVPRPGCGDVRESEAGQSTRKRGKADDDRDVCRRRATTCCASSPTIRRVTAAADSSAAGPTALVKVAVQAMKRSMFDRRARGVRARGPRRARPDRGRRCRNRRGLQDQRAS